VSTSCAAQAGMYDTDTGLYCLTLDSQIQIKCVHIELLLDSFPLVGACLSVTYCIHVRGTSKRVK